MPIKYDQRSFEHNYVADTGRFENGQKHRACPDFNVSVYCLFSFRARARS